MKKLFPILLVFCLLGNLLTGIPLFVQGSSVVGTACELNQDGSVTVG